MNPFWRTPTLSGLLNFYLGLGLTGFTLLAALFFHQIVAHTLEDTLRDKAQALSEQLALMTLDSVLIRDYAVIERFADDLVHQSQDIVYLRISTLEGDLLAESGIKPQDYASQYLQQTTPILFIHRPLGEIELIYSRELINSTLNKMMILAFLGLLGLLVLQSWLIKKLLAAKLIQPIEQLLSRLNPLHSSLNLTPLLLKHAPKEVEALNGIFNQLQQDINSHIQALEQAHQFSNQMTERLRDAQRLASIGQMAAGLAHNLNTPLANIIGYAQMVKSATHDATIQKRMQIIERQAKTSAEVVKSLLNASRSPKAELVTLEGAAYLTSFCALVTPVLKQKGLRQLHQQIDAVNFIADGGMLEQVLFNLFGNAVEAQATEITVKLTSEHNPTPSGIKVWLHIIDNGNGIPAQLQTMIFDAFVTNKPSHQGTGLGLFIAKQMIEAMHGELELVKSQSGHTEFKITLSTELNKQTEQKTND